MFTPEQIAMIRKKDAALPDALKRDESINYYEGYFFLTLNTRGESPILSTVCGRVGGEGVDAPHCEYTAVGRGVIASWERMPKVCPTVRIGPCEAMPEHFHGILHLLPGNRRHLGTLVSGFMAGCTHAYWDTLGIDWRGPCMENGVYTPKMHHRDRAHTRSFIGPALFVHGYNDVEAITPDEVRIKLDYIAKQAEKRLIQGDRHECFRIRRQQLSANWNTTAIAKALAADRLFANDKAAMDEARRKILTRLNACGSSLCLDFLGNRDLLASEKKLPLVCHRRDKALFERQKEAVLDAARGGFVIVSAFISPKEREIQKQLLVEQLPFVQIMDNGFPERYKPSGKAFYACGENRLVQLTCWNYLYQRELKVSREMCLVMNQLARVVAGRDDDWWKNNVF
ncbi:MAG: hypothetical protein ACI3Y0_01590 [Prevotella sp.]